MAVWEGKKYVLTSSDKFDEYLKLLGVNMIVRKMATSATPTIFLVANKDGTYSFTTQAPMKTSVLKFKLNEEFVEDTMDGRKVNTIMTLDGNTLTQTQSGDKASTIVREFSETGCVCTMTLGNVTCVRKYTVG